VNASECRVGIAHRFNNPNQKIKSSIRRGDACHHPDLLRLWQNAKAGRPQATQARQVLLWGQEGSPLQNPVLLMAFVSLMACAPTRATQSSNAVATAKAGVVSLVVNPLGDAVCVATDTSVAVFSRAATRGQIGHTWFEAPARVSSLAWYNNAWWLALPRVGLVQKADGVPQSVAVAGQPTLLSNRLIFTLEGEVFRYDGSRVGRLPKVPANVLDSKDTSFAVVGKEIYSIANTITRVRSLENTNVSLVAAETGFEVVNGSAVRQANYTYTLDKNTIKVSSNNQLIKTISLPATGAKIAVGGDTLAVAIGSSVMFFDAQSFAPLITRACEVTR
jgi:hypothetical protein